jgi:hypothetical protein
MQLRSFTPRIQALDTLFLLQDGYTLDRHNPRLGEVTLGDIAHVGADQAGRAWRNVVAALRRGGERVVERRRQEASRLIRRVSAQCGYGAGSRPMVVQPAVSREVSQRRAEVMRGFFPKLASWYEHRSYMVQMRDVDRYLSQSTDLADLERRVRDIERRAAGSGWF